jgi:hypothetical protein
MVKHLVGFFENDLRIGVKEPQQKEH